MYKIINKKGGNIMYNVFIILMTVAFLVSGGCAFSPKVGAVPLDIQTQLRDMQTELNAIKVIATSNIKIDKPEVSGIRLGNFSLDMSWFCVLLMLAQQWGISYAIVRRSNVEWLKTMLKYKTAKLSLKRK
jgi:hypothetical protein